MSIKFVCSCGKRMRARDEMAGRRSVCPRCGNPVGIPSLQANHPSSNRLPMSPAERIARQTRSHLAPVDGAGGQLLIVPPRSESEILDAVVDRRTAEFWKSHPDAAVLPKGRPARRGQMGTAWYHCLLYPVRAWPLVLGLAVSLSILGVVALFVLWPVLAD